MISPEARQKIQLALIAALVVASVRAGIIFYQRHQERIAIEQQKKAKDAGYANADYYVNPKKLHPFDLKTAKQLTEQPAWVREGFHFAYYPYDTATKRVDFSHEAGLLGPIEKLAIKDVITSNPPGGGDKRQVMAVFEKEGKSYVVPIGYEGNGEFTIYSDDMFFIEDPHDLYKHWPADVWQSVEQHQVKPGMNEMQTDFAVGMGIPDSGSSQLERTVRYPNGGKPLVIVFHDGKVAEVKPDTAAAPHASS
jgi:hypothetical protein